MNYQGKTKDELIKELLVLKQKYDSLETSYLKDSTDCNQTEKELRLQSEIMKNIAEGVNLIRLDNEIIVFTNPKFDEMFGYERGELIGKNISLVNASGDKSPDETKQDIINIVNRSGEWHGEILNIKKNGDQFWCYVNISTLVHPDYGKVYLSVHSDINKLKQAEGDLKQSLDWQKAIFEGSRDAIFISDHDSRFVAVNNSACNLTGYSREQLLKMRIPDIHDLNDLKAYKMYHRRIFGGEEILSEAKILRRNGQKIDAEFNNRRIFIAGKHYMHTTARDITQRKQAEEALRFEKENFRNSLDDSPLGVRIVSAEGDTIYANQTILNFYGYNSLKELQKTPLKNRYTPESYAESQKRKMQRKNGDYSTNKYEISIVRKDGEIRHLRVFRKEVLWDGILQFQIIYDDITDHKQVEEESRKSKKLLEDLHMHLNEILENERAQISREIHDQIGQSLTALKLDLNWMYKYIRTNPEAVAKLESMIDLVSNTIKDVQRISSDLRPGILDELGLVSAIEWYCDEFEKRTGIKCNLKLDDSDYNNSYINLTFFRVLQETLTNVIRHARASSVKVILQQTNQGATLTIQDNGIGISREEIVSNKSLGLISMHERVKQFNGKIEISSKKGDGTKLTVFIPS